MVYQWVDPKQPPFQQAPDFLLARSEGQFKENYKRELDMQRQALKGENPSDRIFVNELMQLYDLLSRVARDSELEFA